jgi:hypothetical protein
MLLFHDKVTIQPIDKHNFIKQEVWSQTHHVYFDSIIRCIDLIELSYKFDFYSEIYNGYGHEFLWVGSLLVGKLTMNFS